MVFSSDYIGLYFVRQRIILINEFWHIIVQIIVRVKIIPHTMPKLKTVLRVEDSCL